MERCSHHVVVAVGTVKKSVSGEELVFYDSSEFSSTRITKAIFASLCTLLSVIMRHLSRYFVLGYYILLWFDTKTTRPLLITKENDKVQKITTRVIVQLRILIKNLQNR